MQTDSNNNNNNHSCNLKTSNNYMFNLIQSATKKVNFRDAIDVATIINDSHHIYRSGSDKDSLQYKRTA